VSSLVVTSEVGAFLDALNDLLESSMNDGVSGGITLPPSAYHAIDPAREDLRQMIKDGWRVAFASLLNGFIELGIPGVASGDGGSGLGGSPASAEYILGSPNVTLTNGRVLTDSDTIRWDLDTAGQIKAHFIGEVPAGEAGPPGPAGADGSAAGAGFDATCPSGLIVGDLVYVDGPGTVALANISNAASGRVVGMIETKPTATTCHVRTSGTMTGLSGLTTGERYWGNALGRVSIVCPRGSESVPVLATFIGIATSTTTLELRIAPPIRVKSS
jgi:hypothetical protein